MKGYEQLISDATGLTNPIKLNMIEQYMRQIYFHSTLDWQERHVLEKAARESAADLGATGWRFR